MTPQDNTHFGVEVVSAEGINSQDGWYSASWQCLVLFEVVCAEGINSAGDTSEWVWGNLVQLSGTLFWRSPFDTSTRSQATGTRPQSLRLPEITWHAARITFLCHVLYLTSEGTEVKGDARES